MENVSTVQTHLKVMLSLIISKIDCQIDFVKLFSVLSTRWMIRKTNNFEHFFPNMLTDNKPFSLLMVSLATNACTVLQK